MKKNKKNESKKKNETHQVEEECFAPPKPAQAGWCKVRGWGRSGIFGPVTVAQNF